MIAMSIMAVDYGDVRTGLALSDLTETLAAPAGVIKETNYKTLMKKISEFARQKGVKTIVVGHPKNMDGSEGDRAQKCQKLAKQLFERYNIPTELWDERQTTVIAHNSLNAVNVRGNKRKNIIDEVAATIILQDYLDNKNQTR